MDKEIRLTTREFWTAENPQFRFKRHSSHAIYNLIREYIPENKEGNCVEIGSFPGPFLTVFGELGYTLNGIDFHPKNERELARWLKREGYKTGEFKTIDFYEFTTSNRFDVVSSFGFIEHFKNYKEIILKHIELVNETGYLVITTPNFRGWIQKWLHKTYDKTNLSFHNLESMQPEVWASLLTENGFEIKYKGYFGGFLFWKSAEPMSLLKRKSLWIIERVIQRLRKVLWFQSASFSGYCGIVAKRSKKNNG
jgi:2-polyprenyl-3-methyl-5-hydroxy-6-metoxy-1,4-benzoquinol methylase